MRVRAHSKNHPRYRRSADSTVDDRRTDPGLWLELHSRFSFTVDAAASRANAMLPRFWTRQEDGLKQSWVGERVWCNPPFSNVRPWIEKAWNSFHAAPRSYLTGVSVSVLLLPANLMEQRPWQELVEARRDRFDSPLRTHFLPGRPRFLRPDGVSLGRPPFSLVLLIWGNA